MTEKPTILIANDDGYRAKGLRKLIDLMRTIGKVIVVTTEKVNSAQGHSITMTEPLRYHLHEKGENYEMYVCNGRPVDCVKLGYQVIMDKNPDIVVSGINHGSNASTNLIYSGTMAAAVEACMDKIPAVGFSLDSYSPDAYFDHLDGYIIDIVKNVLERGLPDRVCLNVNFPKYDPENPIKGVRICHQADGRWIEVFDRRNDPSGKEYFWLTGYFEEKDLSEDGDQYALKNNYVSIVPTSYDWTAYFAIDTIKKWNL